MSFGFKALPRHLLRRRHALCCATTDEPATVSLARVALDNAAAATGVAAPTQSCSASLPKCMHLAAGGPSPPNTALLR